MTIFLIVPVIIHACLADYAPCSNGTPCTNDIPCPGAGGTCADGTTCCPTGCCPLPNAVCCPDQKHCCPAGTLSCNLELQMCIGTEGKFISILRKNGRQYSESTSSKAAYGSFSKAFPLTKSQVMSVPCPGGGSCPDYTTCCKSGCCIFPDAVCCEDGLHCCPTGMTCDPKSELCVGGPRKVYSMSPKETGDIGSSGGTDSEIVRTSLSVKSDVVYCPGGQYYCPDFSTCCLLPSGRWGCCPYPSATCCADRIHCCPVGQRCDATSLHCISGYGNELSRKKVPAFILRDY